MLDSQTKSTLASALLCALASISTPTAAASDVEISGHAGTIHARTVTASDETKSAGEWSVVVESDGEDLLACGALAPVDAHQHEVEVPFVVVVPAEGAKQSSATITVYRGDRVVLVETITVHRTRHPADLNMDDRIDSADLSILLAHWGRCVKGEECIADIDDDGWVDGRDMSALVCAWNP